MRGKEIERCLVKLFINCVQLLIPSKHFPETRLKTKQYIICKWAVISFYGFQNSKKETVFFAEIQLRHDINEIYILKELENIRGDYR